MQGGEKEQRHQQGGQTQQPRGAAEALLRKCFGADGWPDQDCEQGTEACSVPNAVCWEIGTFYVPGK